MTNWKVQEVDGERSRECETRSEAEEVKAEMLGLGMDVEIFGPKSYERQNAPNGEEKTDGGSNPAVIHSEVSEEDPRGESVATNDKATYDLPDSQPMDTDPLDWIPSEFVDNIEGTVAINRKGFSVLKQHYSINVTSDVIVGPEDTDFTFCRVKAVATAKDGTVSEAHGSAHVDRGDSLYLLLELADTRAKKRALSDATGVGIVAVEEMRNKP